MALSSPGIGSGLDVNGIVSQLTALERRPIVALQSAASAIQTRISAYGRIQSLVAALRDAAAALAAPTLWRQTTAASGDAATLGAVATGSAAPGVHQVQIDAVARAHGLASEPFGADTTFGTGRLVIEIGRWADGQGAFAADAARTLELDFDDPGTTLEQVRERINAAGGGVTASIVRDEQGARLALRSAETGLDNALRVRAFDADGAPLAAGLGRLAYAPDLGAAPMQQTQGAADAAFSIDGLALRASSNTLGDVLDGVALTLHQPSAAPVALTIGADTNAQRNAIQAFANAYNALNNFLAEQGKYDEASRSASPLQGDSAAIGLRQHLRALLQAPSGGAGAFARLADIGFDVQRDGTIKLDKAQLDAALARPAELARLFAHHDAAGGSTPGVALGLRDAADALTRSDGLLTTRSEGLQARLKRNKTEQERLEARVERTRERLLKQYQALDARIGQLNGLSNYVSQQMMMLNNQFKSSRD